MEDRTTARHGEHPVYERWDNVRRAHSEAAATYQALAEEYQAVARLHRSRAEEIVADVSAAFAAHREPSEDGLDQALFRAREAYEQSARAYHAALDRVWADRDARPETRGGGHAVRLCQEGRSKVMSIEMYAMYDPAVVRNEEFGGVYCADCAPRYGAIFAVTPAPRHAGKCCPACGHSLLPLTSVPVPLAYAQEPEAIEQCGWVSVYNLTPHGVNLLLADGEEVVIPASGVELRCSSTSSATDNALVTATEFTLPDELPAPRDSVLYLVSTMVAQAARRADIVSPRTDATAVRRDGQIVAVRGFQTFLQSARAYHAARPETRRGVTQ